MSVKQLSEIVNTNSNFKNAINLYLNLNKKDKIDSYVPTNSSVNILDQYIDAVLINKSHSTVLIGPYGKGKSHLLLVLLALLSMNDKETVNELLDKIEKVNVKTAQKCRELEDKNKKFLPVIVMGSQDDLNQTFMIALNNALKRENLQDIMPDTYYSYAIDCIKRWKKEYEETYQTYVDLITKRDYSEQKFINQLKACDKEALIVFKEIYPKLTAGSEFNPLAGGDVIPMYKSVADRLREEKGYSGIYIIFDEFSKYIESQDKNATGNSMKMLQDLCELANESKDTQIFLTMVTHKSIKEYGEHLSKRTINAYTGIEGRIEEVYFISSSKNNYELVQNAIRNDDAKLDSVPKSNRFFSSDVRNRYLRLGAFSEFTEKDFEKVILRGCYPLSPIASYALLNISEKVAQNERTLFTFISKDEQNSLARYIKEQDGKQLDSWIVSPELVYDYFKNILKKEVDNELIHNEWLNADYAISRTKDLDKKRILKIIALINIISKPDELSSTKDTIMISSCLSNASELIDELETEKLIYKKNSNNTYTFKTRAGSELRTEIKRRRKSEVDLPRIFEEVSKTQFVMPNKYNYEYSITRYFRSVYMCVDDFLVQHDMRFLFPEDRYQDGIVLFLYSLASKDLEDSVRKKIEEIGLHNVVVVYSKKVFQNLRAVADYDAIQLLKNDEKFMAENAVLNAELQIMEEDFENEILSYLDDAFDSSSKALRAYFDRNGWQFDSKLSLNRCVNNACETYYDKTLVINNELINKQIISTAPIKKARKVIIEKVLNGESTEQYMTGTSPESTIYRAVLENTKNENGYLEGELIDEFSKFIDSCVEKKVCLKELVDVYESAPYGMRRGVFAILFAKQISERNDDVVVYHYDNEVLLDADLLIDMGEHPEEYSMFISKESQEKEKYLNRLSEMFGTKDISNSTGNRISDILVSMQRWYRALPQITKNIKTKSEYFEDEVVVKKLPKFRNIMQKFDANYYEDIFNTIPMLLGDSELEKTCMMLEFIKSKLDGYFDWFSQKLVKETQEVFSKKQDNLIHILMDWYEQQSEIAKHGLQDSVSTEFMNYISSIKTFDEIEVTQKIIRIVSGVYLDSWNDNTNTDYLEKLKELKLEIESMDDDSIEGKNKIIFSDAEGNETAPILFEPVSNGDGAIFRSIIEDALEDFEDLSVNTKVSILADMINRVTRRG